MHMSIIAIDYYVTEPLTYVRPLSNQCSTDVSGRSLVCLGFGNQALFFNEQGCSVVSF